MGLGYSSIGLKLRQFYSALLQIAPSTIAGMHVSAQQIFF